MAKILIALVLLFAVFEVQAADLVWLHDLAQAQTQARAEKKLTLLLFHGSDWCPPCAEMQKQVFDSPQFIAFAQKSLVLVEVDFPETAPQSPELKRANAALKAKFNIGDNFPSVVLLNASGETVFQEMGYDGAGPDELLKILARHALDAKSPEGTAKYKNLEVEEFAKLAADHKNIVLDVRTSKEFQAGHLPGALNMDVNAPDFAERVAKLDKSKTYLVHCAIGVRSAKACEKLNELNFPHLYNLPGGFKAWAKAGQPVEK